MKLTLKQQKALRSLTLIKNQINKTDIHSQFDETFLNLINKGNTLKEFIYKGK